MTEKWRSVANHEGFYEVSDLGRVRSVDRLIERNGAPARLAGKVLAQKAQESGHLNVCLSRSNSQKTVRVHRLVAEAFFGTPGPGVEVRHRDGDPTNNSLANLEYGTRAENVSDMVRHGRSTRGNRAHAAKLTEADVRAIRKARSRGALLRELSEKYGVHNTAISHIALGKTWAWLDAGSGKERVA